MSGDSSPLSASISRGLTDKLVERRKGAALELERSVTSSRYSRHRANIMSYGIAAANSKL